MENNPTRLQNSATFTTSPFTPIFQDKNVEYQKGWCSERVPLPLNSWRRTISGGSGGMMAFNSGRTLPSKWDDAERWITSPVCGYGGGGDGIEKGSGSYNHQVHRRAKSLEKGSGSYNHQVHRRAKSKSGPIESGNYPHYSPIMPVLEAGGGVRNFTVSGEFSPPSTLAELPSSQAKDEKQLEVESHEKDEEPGTVSRRDMATQMSPETNSVISSLKGWSSSPSGEMPDDQQPNDKQCGRKMEMRDVQVDKWVTVLRQWSKRNGGRMSKKDPPDAESLCKSSPVDDQTWPWEVADAAKKFQREEAKINAWENLQKAKAEADIKELEMKLESKRSSSMDKIQKKLRHAEMKAHEMRSSVSDKLALGVYNKHKKGLIPGSFKACFACHS